MNGAIQWERTFLSGRGVLGLLAVAWAGLLAAPATAGAQDAGLAQLARDFAESREDLDQARDRRNEARRELTQIRAELRRQYENDPQVQELRQEVADLRGQYEALRRETLDRLESDEQYRQAREKVQALDELIRTARTTGAPQEQIAELARQKLAWADRVSGMEARALRSNARAQELIDRWGSAYRKLQDALQGVETALAKDDTLEAAEARLRDARDDYDDARASLAGARAAYSVALDQARAEYEYRRGYSPAYWRDRDSWYWNNTD